MALLFFSGLSSAQTTSSLQQARKEYQEENYAEVIKLLEKAGFHREGYLRGYLKINGAWRDHLLFACVKDSPLSAAAPAPLDAGFASAGRGNETGAR